MQPNCCSVWNLPSWEECLRPALQFVDILKHPGGHRQTKSNYYEWLTAAHSFFLSVSRRRTSHRKSEFLFHTLSAYLPVSKWQWLKPASLPQWLFGITLNAVHPSPVYHCMVLRLSQVRPRLWDVLSCIWQLQDSGCIRVQGQCEKTRAPRTHSQRWGQVMRSVRLHRQMHAQLVAQDMCFLPSCGTRSASLLAQNIPSAKC